MTRKGDLLRVCNHNDWPRKDFFECEKTFHERMEATNLRQIFCTCPLPVVSGEVPNRYIATALDALDVLPDRPDLAFDQIYRSIDFGMKKLGGIDKLITSMEQNSALAWNGVVQDLCIHMPIQTGEFIADRIIGCHARESDEHERRLVQRAKRSLGKARYEALKSKFLTAHPQKSDLWEISPQRLHDCSRLIGIMIRISSPLIRSRDGSILDLSIDENLLDWKKKVHVILDCCLTTYRHERAHGAAFSPFKSTKAKLSTYAHAYFCLAFAYMLLIALIENSSGAPLEEKALIDWSGEFTKRYKLFFADHLGTLKI